MKLDEFLEDAGGRPYRQLIQHHIRKQDVRQLMAAAVGETDLLPSELRSDVMSFVDTLNAELLTSRNFWRTATCRDAIDRVLRMANQHFGLNLQVPVHPRAMPATDQDIAIGLFQIATLSFAYTAVDQEEAREFMGIRKGFFRR